MYITAPGVICLRSVQVNLLLGYRHHKQQSVALNIQLPTTERAEFCDLAPPPHPHWRPTVNVLHPAAQLSRELHGNSRRCNFLCGCMQPQQATQEGLEGIPFGRCQLHRRHPPRFLQTVLLLWHSPWKNELSGQFLGGHITIVPQLCTSSPA